MRAGAGDSGAVGFAGVAGVEAAASGAGVTEMAGVIGVADGAGSSAVRSNRGSVMARGIDAGRRRGPGAASAMRAAVASAGLPVSRRM